MKNLKQIAHDWWEKQSCLTANTASFEAGYKEAQRWISIEEELPINCSNLLLVKWENKNGQTKYGLATFIDFHSIGLSKSHSMDFIIQGSCKRDVTHWRQL